MLVGDGMDKTTISGNRSTAGGTPMYQTATAGEFCCIIKRRKSIGPFTSTLRVWSPKHILGSTVAYKIQKAIADFVVDINLIEPTFQELS